METDSKPPPTEDKWVLNPYKVFLAEAVLALTAIGGLFAGSQLTKRPDYDHDLYNKIKAADTRQADDDGLLRKKDSKRLATIDDMNQLHVEIMEIKQMLSANAIRSSNKTTKSLSGSNLFIDQKTVVPPRQR